MIVAKVRQGLKGLRYFFHFGLYDVLATIVMGTCISFIASGGRSFNLLKTIVYFCLYEQSHTYINQVRGVDEDKINKPDRPIPRGLVTVEEAKVAWVMVMLAYTTIGYMWGVLLPTLLWQAALVAYNVFDFNKVWWSRNLCMSLGYIAMISAGWKLVAPGDGLLVGIELVLSFALLFTMQIQDLRDQIGDKETGRTTFPIVFGDEFSRRFLVGAFALLVTPLEWYSLRVLPPQSGYFEVPYYLVCGVMGLTILVAARCLLYKDAARDHMTYTLYLVLFMAWELAFMYATVNSSPNTLPTTPNCTASLPAQLV